MELLKKAFGMRTMGVLMMIFGVTIGVATFVETMYGTPSAKAAIYNATWFEVLLILLTINLIVVVFTYQLYKKEKWVSLTFHLAFILILIGAGITRFVGFEGMMSIREGETSNTFSSEKTYVSVHANGEKLDDEPVLFSKLTGADYNKSFETGNKSIRVEAKNFISHAVKKLKEDPENGKPVITLVTSGQFGRQNEYIFEGETKVIANLLMSYNDTTDVNAIQIYKSDSGLMMRAPIEIDFMRMADQSQGHIHTGEWGRFNMRQLYTAGGSNFVFSAYTPHGIEYYEEDENPESNFPDAVIFEVSTGETTEEVVVAGGKGYRQRATFINLDGIEIAVSFGSLQFQLPFSIKLEDFQLDRYPGSESPSSYASEVVLIDEEAGITMPFRIYMNNILEHRGYRFYQSSYDRDELGTVLSVNHDYWGTFVTYWGYFFLALGMILIFFSKNTRFSKLNKMIDNIHKKRLKEGLAILIFLFLGVGVNAQETNTKLTVPDTEHAELFGSVLVMKQDGRITPLNTYANEILRKVYKKGSYEGLSADQVFLGMILNSHQWQNEKLIRVNNKDLYAIIGITDKYAALTDFFTPEGQYKLSKFVEQSFQKKPSQRNQLDKELISVDERVNIAYGAMIGSYLKVFPIPGHPDNKWTSPTEKQIGLNHEDSLFITGFIPIYFEALKTASETGDYTQANDFIKGLKNFQVKYGGEILPDPAKVKLEIAYNNSNLFKRLFPYYMLIGFALLILLYIRLLRPRTKLKYGILSMEILIFILFILHFIGLGLRWYISGHEPWSDGYESMIYIAWASVLSGLIFRKKSPITMAVTAILAGIILFVAHLSWMDPEITNLVPVLKSYWLSIHVATITASYGFLALGALLAFVNLVSMIARNDANRLRLNLTIKEVTYVIEMTLSVGLVLLTIGNFLGGIWANESWGRYWGWDPKETWAMATIIFYSFVLHMRFIPGLRGIYSFNFAAIITFSSVIMTYFGVNYYLSGLHSYAKGEPVPVPTFVYYTLGVIASVAILAFINEIADRKMTAKSSKNEQ